MTSNGDENWVGGNQILASISFDDHYLKITRHSSITRARGELESGVGTGLKLEHSEASPVTHGYMLEPTT